MKKRIFILFILIFIISFVSAGPINDSLHLNIQTVNSSDDIVTGTFHFEFNISTTNDCSNIVYNNFTNLTTDSRGIISYYLENTNLNYSDQYWLCYYRDGTLINASRIARNPYTFRARNITISGVEVDSNFNMGIYNLSFSGGYIGIGTTTPNALLEIMKRDGAGYNLNVSGLLYANDTNVGIGTNNPSAKLAVEVSSGGAATIGSLNTATGDYAIAMGYNTTATGQYSTTMGYNTTASNAYSTAMGYNTTATGQYSTTIGRGTIASNINTISIGALSVASGLASIAIGYNTAASGSYSTSMGYNTAASGAYSTSMGIGTIASGSSSTAMGLYTITSGDYGSTAIGYRTNASGDYSTAIGYEIEAGGNNAIAIGLGGITGVNCSQVNSMCIMGGNIGIGITTPNALLEIKKRDGAGYNLNVSGLLYVNDTNVGIGTNNADEELHVYSGSPTIKLESSGAGSMKLSFAAASNGGVISLDADDSASEYLRFLKNPGNLEVMRIHTNGKIGIRASAPTYLLEIGYNETALNVSGNFYANNTQTWIMGGNLGIGTASPVEKLEVAGNVTFQGNITLAPPGGTAGHILNNGTDIIID